MNAVLTGEYLAMPYVTAAGKLIYFAHVPKAGGSSVENYLAARFGPLAMLDRNWTHYRFDEGGWRTSSLRCSPQHVAAEDVSRLLPRAPDWSFAVIRDPAGRLISEYRWHRSNAPRRGRRYLTKLGFSVWLQIMVQAVRRDPTIFDNHLRPQADIVPEDAEIFRLEDGFAPLVARIDTVMGAQAPELSIGHDLKAKADVVAQPSARDLALIAKVYARDYALGGYERPATRVSPSPGAALIGWIARPVVAMLWHRGLL
jgi:hypothetical protein